MSLAIDYSDGKFELGKNTLILGLQNKGKTNLVLTNIFLRSYFLRYSGTFLNCLYRLAFWTIHFEEFG